MKTKTKKEARYKMNKINRKKEILKTNPFTHEEIKDSQKKVKKYFSKKSLEKAIHDDFVDAFAYSILSTNFVPKKKINYYKLTFKVLDILAISLGYIGMATILVIMAVLWMMK